MLDPDLDPDSDATLFCQFCTIQQRCIVNPDLHCYFSCQFFLRASLYLPLTRAFSVKSPTHNLNWFWPEGLVTKNGKQRLKKES
jgi:hypothetical protein